ncbi:HAD family phosphatase [Actinacidiphila glaucinigra]|uniref:HAD family hydrolase n=1 Tax=Actinacidiphila glaucinigra TaxID=235986 RepID=UPI002DD7B727|nr:HAD family phosphatase [Actinacidiphila glaucinigra]WSD60888.1 HAD family phosphatase [Actinacidiphila glaucinigra]
MASTDPEWLLSRVRGVKVVLFDFDGPLCDLFAEYSAEMVAEHMKGYLDSEGWLLPKFSLYTDTHQLLYDVAEHGVPERILRGLDAVLVEAERQAAKVAHPTAGAAELIGLLAAADRPIAITTNNSAASVQVYLKEQGLDRSFNGRIFGRGDSPQLMKPHPSCLWEAMRAVGWENAPDNCLMVGDSTRDLVAAHRAGVRFLAYAGRGERYRARGEALLAAGADFLVRDMREVTEAFSRADLRCRSAHVSE